MEVMDGVFFANLWMTPVFLLFVDTSYFMRVFSLWRLKSFIETGEGTVYTQHEANEIYKKVQWNVGQKYAVIMKTLALTMFYMSIMPYCVFYTLITFAIQYYAEKVG